MTDTTTDREPPFGSREHAMLVAGHRSDDIHRNLQWLTYGHLPPTLQPFSEPFYRAAVKVLWEISTDGPELVASLVRLLEAKDNAVRAGIAHTTGRAGSIPRPQTVTEPPTLTTSAGPASCDPATGRHVTPHRGCILR